MESRLFKHRQIVSVELLTLAQSLKVGLDLKWNNGGGAVGQVLFERFGFHSRFPVYLDGSRCRCESRAWCRMLGETMVDLRDRFQ